MITEINKNTALSHSCELDGVRLSQHFKLSEFLNLKKYPQNIPSTEVVVNLTYGCHLLLEPARVVAGPLIVNSGFRNPDVNQKVGGVRSSQHLLGQAADIRPRDPSQFWHLVEFLKICEQSDQLLTGSGCFTSPGIPSPLPATTSASATTSKRAQKYLKGHG